jgi:hypothetical protein
MRRRPARSPSPLAKKAVGAAAGAGAAARLWCPPPLHLVATVLCWVAYLTESLAGALAGPMLPGLESKCKLQTATLTIMVTTFNIGGSVGSWLGGMAFDSVAAHSGEGGGVPRGGFALLSTLLLAIAAANAVGCVPCDPTLIAAAAFAHGVANGAFRTGANWAMLRLHSASAVAPYVQTMHFCSGGGRYLASVIGAYFLARDEVYWAFYTGSLVAAAAGMAFALMALLVTGTVAPPSLVDAPAVAAAAFTKAPKRAATRPKATAAAAAAADVQATAIIRAVAVFVFLIMGTQNAFQYLLPTYAVVASTSGAGADGVGGGGGFSFDPSSAATLSSKYGLMFTAGRLISIPLSVRFSAFSLIVLCISIAVAALASIVMSPASSETLSLAAAAMGLSLAAVFPSAINFAKSSVGMDRGLRASELSLLMLSGTAGGALLPWCCGCVLRGEVQLPWPTSSPPSGPPAMMALLLAITAASAAALVAAGAAAAVVPSPGREDEVKAKQT